MKVELFSFQEEALEDLRMKTAMALGYYRGTKSPQVVSFTAPTGAGKTIITTALFESILFGSDNFPEQPDAIFLWISDSPELNEQSKIKVDTKSDKITLGQSITIEHPNFDQEVFDDGHIYFLNTQKLSVSSNLTIKGDGRQHTIWETIANTAEEKSDRFYVVIDEAHRGAKQNDHNRQLTIMQKFIKGSQSDGLPAMPLVIGMSATIERFNKLIANVDSSTHRTIISVDNVRESGLLKDKIIITYPDEDIKNKDMAILQAATDEWKSKWDHWYQYCVEQHYSHVNPMFLIQVANRSGNRISKTDLDASMETIEHRLGEKFKPGEVVHAFGDTTSDILINGLSVPYIEPSRIDDDRNIKIVFFKESLSTGWDSPRSEVLMSFRSASDVTYITQLLGRMIRTPKQMRIVVDESLNEVAVFLPYFNQESVEEVIDKLQSSEGQELATDIEGHSLNDPSKEIWSVRPTRRIPQSTTDSPSQVTNTERERETETPSRETSIGIDIPTVPETHQDEDSTRQVRPFVDTTENNDEVDMFQLEAVELVEYDFDNQPTEHEKVLKFINESGLLNYTVRTVKTKDYLPSMYDLIRFLNQTNIAPNVMDEVYDQIVNEIRNYIVKLETSGQYKELSDDVMAFRLSTSIYDVFGEEISEQNVEYGFYMATDIDIERQLNQAERQLGNQGIGQRYLEKYYDEDNPNQSRIDVILFVVDEASQEQLEIFARNTFHELSDEYRMYTTRLDEGSQKRYERIVSNSDKISERNLRLPEQFYESILDDKDGIQFVNHLYLNSEGVARIKLNDWELDIIREEEQRDDFVFWFRNPSRKPSSLTIPYFDGKHSKPMYPDFLIIRKDPVLEYIIDILEPHSPDYDDNLPKAKGMAEYANNNPGIGRIQLIRKLKSGRNRNKYVRLDLTKSAVRESVKNISSPDQLNQLFHDYGESDS